MLFFHAFSGCDTVSGFRYKKKKSFLQTWNVFPEVTNTFQKLSRNTNTIEDVDIQTLARFVVALYDRSSSCSDVDSARKCLFLQKNTRFDNLPPTNAALIQHIKRATYQGGIVWGQTLQTQPLLPSPNQWGWMKNSDGSWGIHWTELNSISDECKELCKCSCKKDCSVRCSCRKTNLPCTSICYCPCVIDDQ